MLESFCEGFIFANSVKRHICHVKNSGLRGHDLAKSVNDSRFAVWGEFYLHKISICEVSRK